jgi:transposase
VSGAERRQVFDLPAQRREVTEHVAERRRCACGCDTTALFPTEATAPACWGPRVRAYALYLMNRQLIPVERTAEILADLLGAPVSTGWLAGLSREASTALVPFMGDLADRLADEPVVHVDETSARVAGMKWWFHVAATTVLTFLGVHARRGVEATDDFGILTRVTGTLVHDRWAPYWTYTGATHAICNAHILRDLAGVGEIASQKAWTVAMIELLVEAKRRSDTAAEDGLDQLPRGQRAALRARYNRIVADAFTANPDPPPGRKRTKIQREGYNLAVALRDHAPEILRFTTNLAVPFDNNQAERDLRMAKLQQKISGTFRTETGAQRFAAVRSYIETGRKHGHNPIDLLIDLFNGTPWTIPPAAPAT